MRGPVVYVDESGDEGFKFAPSFQGSSRWFVLSAVVVPRSEDLALVRALQDVRQVLKKPPQHALHFKKLQHAQKVAWVRHASHLKFHAVNVLVYKPALERAPYLSSSPFALYFYACRLLVERVSWLCRDTPALSASGPAELIFSNRSAMSYAALSRYLSHVQEKIPNKVDWSFVRPDALRAVNHDQLAGLQWADALASGVFSAVNPNPYGDVEPRYLQLLCSKFYRHQGRVLGYGLKCLGECEKAVEQNLQAWSAVP